MNIYGDLQSIKYLLNKQTRIMSINYYGKYIHSVKLFGERFRNYGRALTI